MTDKIISQEYLQTIFDYKEGEFYYKKKYARNIKIGKKVGSSLGGLYKRTKFNGSKHYLHRLIFLYHYGYLTEEIDHIDGNSLNNKIENLRATNRFGNAKNRKLAKNNSSGTKNVFLDHGKWRVGIKYNNKTLYFGSYENIELAELVAIEARNKYHKEFANHGL